MIVTQTRCRKICTDWGEWAVENEMKINPGKNEAVSFTRARVKEPLKLILGDQLYSAFWGSSFLSGNIGGGVGVGGGINTKGKIHPIKVTEHNLFYCSRNNWCSTRAHTLHPSRCLDIS
jgi:hypothetical protein